MIFIAIFGALFLWVSGYVIGFHIGRTDRQFVCLHRSRMTTFYGMDDLRDLFSGRITSEEYSRKRDMKIVSKCADCGKVLK